MKYLLLLFVFGTFLFPELAIAAAPDLKCGALPGCESGFNETDGGGVYQVVANIIAALIKYVAVIAVIAVMIGGIMFLTSSGDEEKIKKARTIIIWALVGVFVSSIAWSLIGVVNNFVV